MAGTPGSTQARPCSTRAPVRATYRLQISPSFTLHDAIGVLDRLADLGVSHLYLSPLLQASAGSTHGYDVVDPTRVDDARGGEEGLRRLADAAHERGLGIVLDIVPNHLSVAIPRENPAWWDVLTFGRDSRYASWFDIDWAAGPIVLPVLADGAAIEELTLVAGAAGVEIGYGEQRFPVRPGTQSGTAQEVHARQTYRLVDWRRGAAELTYRRFFDVATLAGLRVEDPEVYGETHALVLRLVGDGTVDGLRIDHPDGLAVPGAYLKWLRRDTGGVWTVVEKILEPGERLPDTWACAGTTGYDAARLVTGVLVDPAGERPLTELWERASGRTETFEEEVVEAKREITRTSLAAEVARIGRLAPEVDEAAVADVLTNFPVYRSYLPDEGAEYVEEAVEAAAAERPDLESDIELLAERLADPDDPLSRRFQQTSGMVMAKGVEDTAFYRHHVLIALNEVGSDPARFGVGVDEWHAECAALQANWPATMTLLSSHDHKRSEDVRARVLLLAQIPGEWEQAARALDEATTGYRGRVAPEDRYLLHQTLAGTGEIEADRLVGYLHKATREAKRNTAWVDGDPDYDADVETLGRAVLTDPGYLSVLRALLARLDPAWTSTLAAHKILQLTMPGVPDIYQGCERVSLTLVDPDNRRPVDFTAPADAKTHVVRTILRLRRERPELFAEYRPVEVASPDALAFARSAGLVVVVNRFALRVERHGWSDATVALPPGEWVDALTGISPASARLDDVLGRRGGAVLVRVGER